MKNRVSALDGVRALAILLVIFHHSVGFIGGGDSRIERAIAVAAKEGWIGVDLFLVLSGYLITGILLKTKSGEGYYRKFMMRRVLRIFPAYYLFVLVFFVILPRLAPSNPELAILPGEQAWYWTYLANVRIFLNDGWKALYVEHAWSLAIEEQFYLVWPWIVLLCSRRALVVLCAVTIPASLVLRTYLASGGAGRAVAFVLMPAHLDGLLLGAILATLEPEMVRRLGRSRQVLALAAGVGFVWLVATRFLSVSYDVKHFGLSVTGWSILFVAFVGICVFAPEDSRLSRALGMGWLRRIGTYSYGLYLWHVPLFRVLAPRVREVRTTPLGQWAIMAALGGLLAFAVAALTYEVYESRFLRLKRFFEPNQTRKPPVAALDAAVDRGEAS